jgi:peptidoglycan hydrolase-like protein with peptidoglycan-binding domain
MQSGRSWPVHDPALTLAVEERLAAQGFDPGPVDGVADERSFQALRAFQHGRGLPVTGVIDKPTAEALGLNWNRLRASVRSGRLEQM